MNENMSPYIGLNKISKPYYEAPTINILSFCQFNIVEYFFFRSERNDIGVPEMKFLGITLSSGENDY